MNCSEMYRSSPAQVSTVKGNAILKLTYLQMLGYDMTWAHFNVVEVMSDSKFWMKRSSLGRLRSPGDRPGHQKSPGV